MSGHPMPIRIRGVVYPSQQAAAIALGVHPTTICKALEAGTLDRVALRMGGNPGKPCVFRGKRYPSRAAAAADCGVSIAKVRAEIAAQASVRRAA